jgi:hypothetical protein
MAEKTEPHVVIVGAGFGGQGVCHGLQGRGKRVTVIDSHDAVSIGTCRLMMNVKNYNSCSLPALVTVTPPPPPASQEPPSPPSHSPNPSLSFPSLPPLRPPSFPVAPLPLPPPPLSPSFQNQPPSAFKSPPPPLPSSAVLLTKARRGTTNLRIVVSLHLLI